MFKFVLNKLMQFKKHIVIFFCYLLLLFPYFIQGQNPLFRQLYTHRYLTNPSMIGMGSSEGQSVNRIASGTKAQWLSIDSRLVTQSFSFDAPIKDNSSSWGAGIFLTDLHSGSGEQSKYSHFSGSLNYAYNIPLKKINLRFGLSAQYSSLSFGVDQFQWEDQVNANLTGFVNPTLEPLQKQTKNVVHASLGALAYNQKGFIGISVFNVNEPNISFFEGQSQTLTRKYFVHGGFVLDHLFNHAILIPNASFSVQGEVSSAQFNTNVKLENLQLGIGVQNVTGYGHSAWAISNYLGFRYDKYFVGYSNDWNLSFNLGSIPVTHEISVLILLKHKISKTSTNPLPEI